MGPASPFCPVSRYYKASCCVSKGQGAVEKAWPWVKNSRGAITVHTARMLRRIIFSVGAKHKHLLRMMYEVSSSLLLCTGNEEMHTFMFVRRFLDLLHDFTRQTQWLFGSLWDFVKIKHGLSRIILSPTVPSWEKRDIQLVSAARTNFLVYGRFFPFYFS